MRLSQLEPPVLEDEEWGLGEEGEGEPEPEATPPSPTEEAEEESEREGEGSDQREGSERDEEFEQAFGSGEEDD